MSKDNLKCGWLGAGLAESPQDIQKSLIEIAGLIPETIGCTDIGLWKLHSVIGVLEVCSHTIACHMIISITVSAEEVQRREDEKSYETSTWLVSIY